MSMQSISEAKRAAQSLVDALGRTDHFSEALAEEYQRQKRALAASFQRMAVAVTKPPIRSFEQLCSDVVEKMHSAFAGQVPSQLLRIPNYGTPHPELYDFLCENSGLDVPMWRLRMLAADAVHTERRLRGLEELGLNIKKHQIDGDMYYCLTNVEPDLDYAAALHLRNQARKQRSIPKSEKTRIINLAERHAELPRSGGGS